MFGIQTRQLFRFVIVGCLNTANYYLLYLSFFHLLEMSYLISHVLAFILSMIGSFFMNTYYTYRTKPSWKKFFQFPVTQLVNFTVTTLSMYILVDLLHFDENITPLFAALIAIPFTFVVTKKILLSQ